MPIIKAIPSKHIFEALIQDVNTETAISDLIDNALDNWKVHKYRDSLEISISISEDEIRIKDNSGGIDIKTFPLLLMPGGTNRLGEKAGIKGIWGVGSKRALYSLGRKYMVFTRAVGETGLILDFDENWFVNDEGEDKWELEYKEDPSLEKGITTFQVTDLKVLLNPLSISKIKKKIAGTYRDEIIVGALKILFNDEPVQAIPEAPWAKSDYAPTVKYLTAIPVDGTGRYLQVEIVAGVMTQPGGEYSYGVDLIGNKRIILQNNLDSKMGFEKGLLGFPHPTINRFKAIVRLSGESRDIPWNSAKNDVSTNHPMYIPIRDLVFQVSRPYVSFLRKNYEVTSTMFKEEVRVEDIKDISFDYNTGFTAVVREFEEPKNTVRLGGVEVAREDYEEVVEYFGLRGKTKTYIALFIFNRALEEARGND